MRLGSMTSEEGCSVQIHLWLRREDVGHVVSDTKCAAKNLGISIRNPSPPTACSSYMYAH